jgi:excisionase family DNA binding protein
MPEKLAYSVDEAAEITGLSRDLLYDEMKRGALDYLKVGRRRIITVQHLASYLRMTPDTFGAFLAASRVNRERAA